VDQVPDELLEVLSRYHWPGNIRELQNFVERVLITSPGKVLTRRVGELRALLSSPQDTTSLTLADAERVHIQRVLKETNWKLGDQDEWCRCRLGLPRTTLIHRMRRLGITNLPRKPWKHNQHIAAIFSDRTTAQVLA
jgi:formate hydrogenlyase transcriptional activator